MSVSAQPDWVRFHILYYLCQLVIITALSYLLRQIIPERIIHYLDKRVNRVLKYQRVSLTVIFLNFFLQEPTPALVFS